jgi:RHS repeat-associated protein
VAQLQNGQARYVHADGLGSVKALSDGRGALTDAYAYAAFGEVLSHAGTSGQPYRFAGEHYDPEAGMQYHRARWYDPAVGRFTALDPFSGNPNRPATLNKYLYASADPANVQDPSGAFGVAEASIASNIAISLSNIQVDFGLNFVSAKLSGEDESPSAMGWGVLASLAPFAIANIAKKTLTIASKMGKYGKVAYLTAKKPLQKEIDAAEFLAERLGVGIYIRGGNSTQGADFFMSGVRWELKTLDKPSVNAVFQNIKKAVSSQSSKIIIDGRKAGLEVDIFEKGLAEAQRKGYFPSEILVLIKKNGADEIMSWP